MPRVRTALHRLLGGRDHGADVELVRVERDEQVGVVDDARNRLKCPTEVIFTQDLLQADDDRPGAVFGGSAEGGRTEGECVLIHHPHLQSDAGPLGRR